MQNVIFYLKQYIRIRLIMVYLRWESHKRFLITFQMIATFDA